MPQKDYRYTRTHEWVQRLDGGRVRVGITDHAQGELGDVVFVELPAVGREVVAGAPFGVVESVKAVSDLVSPVSGRVVEVNGGLAEHPESVNRSAESEAWLVVIEMRDPAEADRLLTAEAYASLVADAVHQPQSGGTP